MYILIPAKATDPPAVKFIIGYKVRQSSPAIDRIIQNIGILVQQENNLFISGIDSISIKPDEILAIISPTRSVSIDYFISDIYPATNKSFIISLFQRTKPDPYLIEVPADDFNALYKKFSEIFTLHLQQINPDEIQHFLSAEDMVSEADIHYLQGLRFLKMHDYPEAHLYFDSAIASDAQHHRAYFAKALCYKYQNNDALYKTFLEDAIRKSPRNGSYLIEMGNYYLHHGEVNRAIAYYRQFENNPRYYDLANWNLYVAYSRLGQSTTAVNHLKTISPDSRFFINAQTIIGKRDIFVKVLKIAFFILLPAAAIFFSILAIRNIYKRKESLADQKVQVSISVVSLLAVILQLIFKFF
jgi:tetratricopeptide (TPR) repeat protein